MFDNIYFYNHWQNGDVLLSREFVSTIMYCVPAKEYHYAHNKSHLLLKDIDNLHHLSIDTLPIYVDMHVPMHTHKNDLYINTWIGKENFKYVQPNHSCTVQKNIWMYSDLGLNIGATDLKIGWDKVPKEYYLPSVDYSKFNIVDIDKQNLDLDSKKKVFICTEDVHSGQSHNFKWANIVFLLAEKYPNISFYTTQDLAISLPNVIPTESIITFKRNLHENAYLASFCNIIVGRSSGVYTACITDRIINSYVTMISFCNHEEDAFWGFNKPNYFWSNDYTKDNIIDTISEAITLK